MDKLKLWDQWVNLL